MIPWQDVNTVMLDMDGTLLDLHFDNYFWQEYVPQQFAYCHRLSEQDAKAQVYPRFAAAAGTLEWYCVDYWSSELGLDIEKLKGEVKHKIQILPHVEDFLSEVQRSQRPLYLVTNAHRKSLSLKLAETGIGEYFDQIISSHDFGVPKENDLFWPALQQALHFDRAKTLFIDDSLSVLQSAQRFGIAHLLSIQRPDSKAPLRTNEHFLGLRDFSELLPC